MTGLLLPMALAAANAAPPGRCATMEILPLTEGIVRQPLPAPPPGAAKSERDPYGVPNAETSENFAIRWGNNGSVDLGDVRDMLEGFERSWEVEVGEMAHPQPWGTDRYLFNVYIGDTGGGTPSSYGAGGYMTNDAEGFPMVVLNPYTVADPTYGVTTAAHEFYHAVQDATGSYSYTGNAAWYWEATASWVEGEVYPDNMSYAVFLFGYAFLPHLALDAFDYPDTGALEEYHQYGAFIFPRYLSELAGDWEIVRNSWVAPQGGTPDPIEALRAELDDRGLDFDDVFADFAAHNATWDYADGDWYEYLLDYYAAYFPRDDARVAFEVGDEGTGGEEAVDAELLPRRYGYDVVALPTSGDMHVAFTGDAEGSGGSEAGFGVTVVTREGATASYHEVSLSGNAGTIDVAAGDADSAYLVVAAWAAERRTAETFGWTFEVEVDDDDGGGGSTGPGQPEVDDDETGGFAADDGEIAGVCHCSAGQRGAGGWAALGALLAAGRRRTPRGARGGAAG